MLNGYDLVKEALVKNGDACIDRPYSYIDAVSMSNCVAYIVIYSQFYNYGMLSD